MSAGPVLHFETYETDQELWTGSIVLVIGSLGDLVQPVMLLQDGQAQQQKVEGFCLGQIQQSSFWTFPLALQLQDRARSVTYCFQLAALADLTEPADR